MIHLVLELGRLGSLDLSTCKNQHLSLCLQYPACISSVSTLYQIQARAQWGGMDQPNSICTSYSCHKGWDSPPHGEACSPFQWNTLKGSHRTCRHLLVSKSMVVPCTVWVIVIKWRQFTLCGWDWNYFPLPVHYKLQWYTTITVCSTYTINLLIFLSPGCVRWSGSGLLLDRSVEGRVSLKLVIQPLTIELDTLIITGDLSLNVDWFMQGAVGLILELLG